MSRPHNPAWLNKFPALVDLKKKAQQRMPPIAWEYLDSGTDNEEAVSENRQDLTSLKFKPKFLNGELSPKTNTRFLDQSYKAPFGIAPIGLTSLMWPDAEKFLADVAKRNDIPYVLSTVATETPEVIGPRCEDMGWFQLYTPKEKEYAFEILDRARSSGFKTLVITVDIPFPSLRQRTKRVGFTSPPKITPSLIWQGVTHPTWALKTLRRGIPSLKTVESHSKYKDAKDVTSFMSNRIGGNLDWAYVEQIKEYWNGPTILKGILHTSDAIKAAESGFDAVWVSNHGGRQFDGAVSSIKALRDISYELKGDIPLIFDSGVRGGLDILRGLASGADFVFLGRAWIYGVAALGRHGAQHVFDILESELINCMHQLGAETIDEIKKLEIIETNE